MAVNRILKYLRRIQDIFLIYGGGEDLREKGYTGVGFQTDRDDSYS